MQRVTTISTSRSRRSSTASTGTVTMGNDLSMIIEHSWFPWSHVECDGFRWIRRSYSFILWSFVLLHLKIVCSFLFLTLIIILLLFLFLFDTGQLFFQLRTGDLQLVNILQQVNVFYACVIHLQYTHDRFHQHIHSSITNK